MNRLREQEDTIKHANICIREVPEVGEKEKQAENI
jgi:hypothetical protein